MDYWGGGGGGGGKRYVGPRSQIIGGAILCFLNVSVLSMCYWFIN